MYKNLRLIIIGCAASLVFTTGIGTYNGGVKRFVGEDGKEITVQSGVKNKSNLEDLESKKKSVIKGPENPLLGDILIVDGVMEKVIAVGDGGEYITELLK
ncbi:hypothetical protein NXH76_07820 [Blautia schinkii]|nr:hypothetical protein [Blautia schinkii]